jgi:hypothetical protein
MMGYFEDVKKMKQNKTLIQTNKQINKMRQVNWDKLERGKKYIIEKICPYSGCTNRKIGKYLYAKLDYTVYFIHFIELENLPCDILPSSMGTSKFNDFSSLCHIFYEFPLQYLQDICEYTPKTIPTLKTLSKIQLVTEEIRISRMYDGLF